jgi:hypothetical protein
MDFIIFHISSQYKMTCLTATMISSVFFLEKFVTELVNMLCPKVILNMVNVELSLISHSL